MNWDYIVYILNLFTILSELLTAENNMNILLKLIKSVRFSIHLHRSFKHWIEKDYAKGKKNIDVASKILPLTGEFLLMRAVFNRRLKEYAESIDDAKKALAILPHEKYSIHDKNYLMLYAYKVMKLSEYYLANNGGSFISIDQDAPIKREDLNISKTTKFLTKMYKIDGW